MSARSSGPPPEEADVAAAYDLWADSYDTDPNRTRELAEKILRSAPLRLSGRQLVEAGCGTGRNTAWLEERASAVLGLDLSAGMLHRARGRGLSSRVRLVRADLRTSWPLREGSADALVAVLVLEHVEELTPFFREAARVLRGDGDLFVCELHPTRQRLGARAQFTHPHTGERERVAAFQHEVSDFVDGGREAGLSLLRFGEWRDDRDTESGPPRLLSLLWRRTAAGRGSARVARL